MEKRAVTSTTNPEIEVLRSLEILGLNASEAKIYVAIVRVGKTNVSTIANETGINRRNVYDALSTLIDKGLVFQIISEREGAYAAVEPQKLLELIQSKEMALEAIMPSLQQRFDSPSPGENAVIYKGIEGFKNYLEDILATGQDVYCLGAKGGWGYSKLGDYTDWFEQERIAKKIKVYNLFDHEMRIALEKETSLYDTFAERRFLPKEISTNSAVDVFGDTVVTFTGLYPERFDDDVTLFVMTNRDIAEAFRIWFQLMWDSSATK